jgi:hypothetical protein
MKNTHKDPFKSAEVTGFLVCPASSPALAMRWALACRDAGRPIIVVTTYRNSQTCLVSAEYDEKTHEQVVPMLWNMYMKLSWKWAGPETWKFQVRHRGHVEMSGVPAAWAEVLAFRATEHFLAAGGTEAVHEKSTS